MLRRIAEAGGGKFLDPAALTPNPFSHDRKKTYQPRDLWESLLQFAILLFTVDVGVRRIQIGREEWQRFWQIARRWLFLWRAPPPPPEAQESLQALLARRAQVRSQQTAPTAEPSPDLFQPQHAATQPLPGEETSTEAVEEPAAAPPAESSKPLAGPEGSTASRLLEAKRRAQKRKR